MGGAFRPAYEVRKPFNLSNRWSVLRRSSARHAAVGRRSFKYALVSLGFLSSTLAGTRDSHLSLLELQSKLPPLGLADQLYAYGAWLVLLAGGFAGVMYWRLKSRLRRSELGAMQSGAAIRSSVGPPSLNGVDLKLLWFMSDEKSEALPAQIERYIAAFETDLVLTHAAVLSRDATQIHGGAHRLVAHAAAVNYEPLRLLANKLQAEASSLRSDQLDELMQDFDLQFAKLRMTLAAIQPST